MLVIDSAFLRLNFVRILASRRGRTEMERNSRRSFLKGAGAAVIVPPASERAPHYVSRRAPDSFFTIDEAIHGPAAVHLIPAIDTGAGRSSSSLGVGYTGPYDVNKQDIRS